MNSFNRANIYTGGAIGAFFSINYIDITFSNSFFRAFIYTRTACSTFIIYYVCHFKFKLMGETKLGTNLYFNSINMDLFK